MIANFAYGLNDEDDVSMQRTAEEPRQHCVFRTRSTIQGMIYLLKIDEKAGDNRVSTCRVKML